MNHMQPDLAISRRRFLAVGAGAAGAAVLSACGAAGQSPLVGPASPSVSAVEAARARSGRTVSLSLTAAAVTADLAGRQVSTWAYQSALAGPEIRVRPGDVLDVTVANRLPAPTSIHWHGLAVDNAFDGVPGVTQAAIAEGGSFRYRFVVPDSGTYWYHSHQGLQLDRGLYGPLIVEDPADPPVDVDQALILDDWLDGLPGTPDQQLAALRHTMSGMSGMSGSMGDMPGMSAGTASSANSQMGAMTSGLLGGDAGDVAYPLHLVNGRPPADRPTVVSPPGGRVRLRLINAGSDTAYRVAIGGHRLVVTHADGRPVVPVTVDTLLIGMGERYDITFTARSGAWPIYALAEGKQSHASAVLRTTDTNAVTSPPPPDTSPPAELDRQILAYHQLQPTPGDALTARPPDRSYTVDLTGNMSAYQWGLAGDAGRLDVTQGQRVRVTFRNRSRMWHPMHLHGHTFALADLAGARKDTVNVLPGESVVLDFDADNPGQWMLHCHNTYHLDTGMATTVSYRRS